MFAENTSIEMLEVVAKALRPLLEQVAFIGGS